MTAPGSTAVSFDAFYRAQHARVLGYFRRKAGRDAAPDLAQEVFTRLLRSGALERAECPEAYLTRIARNLLIDNARCKRPRPTAFYSLDEERDAVSCADQTWRIEAADLSHLYRRTVRAMPPKTRRVFLMRRVRRMSYKEIAASLGVSVATVDYHMVQALALCRAAVAAQW
ncbi:RNA polymerase sigma-70 factor (ECF subfamily) [Sphingopyxis italica]|uniref:RNA polymerase sigma-70 factor (ECF subfamily) n=1 Tax=Sphingopyxis italica TaxID=1129133 RepID=A0A7X5XPR7_9SPHN|nr:sigma-70 family RNA polymerase sigma factor [Sphingopyxis italica]NJB88990.1 RNA polymerase sigma-70 factor (ECF subfamily) [Sphingopyxis italica]